MTGRMKTQLDCLPCYLRQALDAARMVIDDEEVQHAVMHQVCHALQLIDVRHSPPAMAQQVHRIIRAILGDDPYREIKARMNRLGVELRERLRAQVEHATDPFDAAVRVAIAANCIDFGARSAVPDTRMVRFIEAAFTAPLYGSVDVLRNAAARAKRILYLADNVGELALDRLLIEQLPRGSVTVAVRGRPVINDATLADARAVGIEPWATVIDNGSDAPGTLLNDCSIRFRETFARADLILAKGQGNYESLAGTRSRPIHFLFVPKCPLVSTHAGAPQDMLVVKSPAQSRRTDPRRSASAPDTEGSTQSKRQPVGALES